MCAFNIASQDVVRSGSGLHTQQTRRRYVGGGNWAGREQKVGSVRPPPSDARGLDNSKFYQTEVLACITRAICDTLSKLYGAQNSRNPLVGQGWDSYQGI